MGFGFEIGIWVVWFWCFDVGVVVFVVGIIGLIFMGFIFNR